MECGAKPRNPAEPSTRLGTAAHWLQRLDDPHLKEEDIRAWLEWFSASDANRKAFEELQALRRRLREMPESYRDEVRRRVPADRPSLPSTRRKASRPIGLALAASMCAAALTFVFWRPQTDIGTTVYTAPVSQHRTVTLDDGSVVVLAAEAIIDVTYSRELRVLDIQRGAAYFEVRPDPGRPFVVEASGIRVTAIGTAFNVQRAADKVTVTVTQGKVSIARPGGSAIASTDVRAQAAPHRSAPIDQEVVVRSGQRAVLSLAVGAGAMAPGEKASQSEWKDDRAAFIDTPLSQVLHVVNRHASSQLVIDDPRVADLTYSGTILRDHIDEWVTSLPKVYPIRAVPMDDGTITLVSR